MLAKRKILTLFPEQHQGFSAISAFLNHMWDQQNQTVKAN